MASKDSNDDDDFVDDANDWQDDESEVEQDAIQVKPTLHRQRDWRDMERYKEERELKRLMQEDYLFDDDERPSRR